MTSPQRGERGSNPCRGIAACPSDRRSRVTGRPPGWAARRRAKLASRLRKSGLVSHPQFDPQNERPYTTSVVLGPRASKSLKNLRRQDCHGRGWRLRSRARLQRTCRIWRSKDRNWPGQPRLGRELRGGRRSATARSSCLASQSRPFATAPLLELDSKRVF